MSYRRILLAGLVGLIVHVAPLAARAGEAPALSAKTLQTRYGRLHVETEGSGPPLVLVAGGPGASRISFQPWFSRLADRHTVVYFDAIGRGRSDRLADPAGYTVEREIEDIEAVRVALGAERISLLGQSYGGIPALLYALRHPGRVERLVLSSAMIDAASFQANIDATNANLKTYFPDSWMRVQALRAQGVRSGDERSGAEYARMKDMLYWYDPRRAAEMKRAEPADKFNAQVYEAMLGDDPDHVVGGTLKGYDPTPLLPSLRAPTLVIGGRYDRVATPEIVFRTHAVLPSGLARLAMFERSGHRPWVEEADAYFDLLRKFLAGEEMPSKRGSP
ncbi:MAG TPA: alpha/beta fold hydrolase [Paucimonas sp.]|nr:alpha/beta fold hydrolase [Paucimonas sp.]